MKTLIRYLGYLFIISSFFRVVPIVFGLYYGESVILFAVSALVSLVIGGFLVLAALRKTGNPCESGLTLTHGLLLAALSFVLLPLVAAISFLPSLKYNLLDAYFEAISGFTTTGLTLYSSLDLLPKSLLIWRAETQWMGGIGIVMVFLFIFSRLHAHDYTRISDIESKTESTMALYQSQGFTKKLASGFNNSLSRVMAIYCGYTLLGIALLYFTGLPFFEALGMTFTALSTGGFAVTDAFYSNSWQLLVISLLMILGSISFITHNKLFRGKLKQFLFSFEKNVFLILVAASVLVTLTVFTDLKVVLFQLISAFTTSGYSIANIPLLPPLFIVMITVGMMVGGGAASTSGGIKVFRIYYFFRAIPWSIKKLISPPKAIIPFSIHGDVMDEPRLINIGIFIYTYFLILLLGTMIFMVFGYGFLDSSFQIVSALGTVGLQTMDLAVLNPLLKSVLMVSMLFGRLEIFPLMILIRAVFKTRSA